MASIDQIFHILTDPESSPHLVKLTISPLVREKFNQCYGTAFQDGFVYVNDEKELLVFKDEYLRIFVQAYHAKDPRGLLLTTNENPTLINSLSVDGSWAQLRYVCSLLSCTSNRINKSSSLWLFLKKIMLKMAQMPENRAMWLLILETVALSASRHISNYYCWEFMRFYLNCSVLHSSYDLKSVGDMVVGHCQSNIKDSSSWSFLVYLMNLKMVDTFYYGQYLRICRELGTVPMQNDHKTEFDCGFSIPLFDSVSWIPYQVYLLNPSLVPEGFFDSLGLAVDVDPDDVGAVERAKIDENKRRLLSKLKSARVIE